MRADARPPTMPLAEALRPGTVSEVFGQGHLLGEGQPLNLAFKHGRLHSMLFWGPPGVGKTTLARLTANAFGAEFVAMPAVGSGAKEMRAVGEMAEQHRARGLRTTLFIDEIHRLDPGRQITLLQLLREGLVTLIGATTENPSFALKKALLSCVRVYLVKPLTHAELQQIFQRAHRKALAHLQFDAAAVAVLVEHADGDARRFLNLLERTSVAAEAADTASITLPFLDSVLTASTRRFDKGGEQFYDQISTLHKSVRGSHPDAALYWFCRMLDGGTDYRYLLRRMASMAWDDIGVADPNAIHIVNNAGATWDRFGPEEGALALAQAVLYLAMATKSNAGAQAFSQAMQFVRHDQPRQVPAVLRDGTRGVPASCLPDGMQAPGWYR